MALKLLRRRRQDGSFEPTEVAQRLRRRYRYVLVDEYQDTSPVQVELLRLVSRDEGNRFLVGDVKQSIYGFRQAEPRLFTDLIEQVRQGAVPGRVQALGENFRSHAGVLEPLNAIFERLFDADLGGSAYDAGERLVACREEVGNPTLDAGPRVELALFESPGDSSQGGQGGGDDNGADEDSAGEQAGDADKADAIELERIEREATWAAQRIRELLEAGTQVPERGSSGPVLRPLEPGDVVVLIRSARGNAPRAAARLRELGVPAVVVGRESLLECLEVQDVLHILRLIANRRQDIPLAAYLRGPVVGLSEQALLEIRSVSGGAFWQAVFEYLREPTDKADKAKPAKSQPRDPALLARLREALGRIDHWRQRSRHLELPALVREILRDTALPLVAAARPPGEYRVAMLRALERLAAQFAEAGHAGVREFVDWIERLEDQELAPAVSASLRSDIVRIMTIHASKGLEFPVVLLLNSGAEFERRGGGKNEPLLVEPEAGLSLDGHDVGAGQWWSGPCKPLIREARRRRERSEELRLLYVACTRARELLLIAGHLERDRRAAIRERFAGWEGKLSLFDRIAARSVAEWLLAAVTAAGLDQPGANGQPAVRVVEVPREADASEAQSEPSREDAAGPATAVAMAEADRAWVERTAGLLLEPPDLTLARVPAVLSVSEVKHRAGQIGEPDLREVAPGDDAAAEAFAVRLEGPAFARRQAGPSGTEIGTAYHRLLQFAELDELDSWAAVERQIERLRSRGLLSDAQAAAIDPDDVVWFGRSELGRQVASLRDRVLREQPFVYARPLGGGEQRQLLRGIVDLMWLDEAGWHLVDFKTDGRRRKAEDERRLRMYRAQLAAYGEAIAEISGRPLAAGWLVFLRRRRLEAL